MKRTRNTRLFYKGNAICHLCDLPIPMGIVSRFHPLFGTIDHVIPRGLGGDDSATNRAPAHLCCNALRGTREIGPTLTEECRRAAVAVFAESKSVNLATKQYRTVRVLIDLYQPARRVALVARAG